MHSIQTLMDGLIDYAGLFPPADLEMKPTVANYAEYRSGHNDWMLSRLIVPVGRLEEFERHAHALLPISRDPASDDCWVISALTVPVEHEDFEADLERIDAATSGTCPGWCGRGRHHRVSCGRCRRSGPRAVDPRLDLSVLRTRPSATFEGRSRRWPAVWRQGAHRGRHPEAHPTPVELARFITVCANAEVPFKATAGLHHPLRHHAESVGCSQFGFLNVFVGAALAWNGRCEEDALVRILEAESLEDFQIENDRIGFGGQHVTLDQIEHARERFCHSYGSCSFLEPQEDLHGLKLLTPAQAGS